MLRCQYAIPARLNPTTATTSDPASVSLCRLVAAPRLNVMSARWASVGSGSLSGRVVSHLSAANPRFPALGQSSQSRVLANPRYVDFERANKVGLVEVAACTGGRVRDEEDIVEAG
jgi:hypothetical protein